MFLSHIDVPLSHRCFSLSLSLFPSLSFSLPPSLSKINKIMSLNEDKKPATWNLKLYQWTFSFLLH